MIAKTVSSAVRSQCCTTLRRQVSSSSSSSSLSSHTIISSRRLLGSSSSLFAQQSRLIGGQRDKPTTLDSDSDDDDDDEFLAPSSFSAEFQPEEAFAAESVSAEEMMQTKRQMMTELSRLNVLFPEYKALSESGPRAHWIAENFLKFMHSRDSRELQGKKLIDHVISDLDPDKERTTFIRRGDRDDDDTFKERMAQYFEMVFADEEVVAAFEEHDRKHAPIYSNKERRAYLESLTDIEHLTDQSTFTDEEYTAAQQEIKNGRNSYIPQWIRDIRDEPQAAKIDLQQEVVVVRKKDGSHTTLDEWEAEKQRHKQKLAAEQSSSVPRVDDKGRAHAGGWRKSAVANVQLQPGTGKITVNNKDYIRYFRRVKDRHEICKPLLACGFDAWRRFDVIAHTRGGGNSGQSGAVRLAIARALCKYNPKAFMPKIKAADLWSIDYRIKERKKPGRTRARRGHQWVKR